MRLGRQVETVYFHPQVQKWLESLGFEYVMHECRIVRGRIDFVAKYKNHFAFIECKNYATEEDLASHIGQVKRYVNEVSREFRKPFLDQHWSVASYQGKTILPCLAINNLIRITFESAYDICADSGVLLLNVDWSKYGNDNNSTA
jgi:Holliday junction resolvase-like predicted endonuclease